MEGRKKEKNRKKKERKSAAPLGPTAQVGESVEKNITCTF